MLIVLSETNLETGKTGMQTWTKYTDDLHRRIPSDELYEQYLNGLIDIEWDMDGNFVRVVPIEDEC